MYPSDSDPAPEWSLHSNESGEFDGLITFRWRGGSPIRAVDPEGKWGGVAHINRHRDPVTIVVHPLMRVKGSVSYEKLPKSLREWNKREGFNRGPYVRVNRKLQPVDGKTPPPE